MAVEEMLANKDHKCRDPKCMGPMPLPKMWGRECPSCGKRQPTLDELKRRAPEPEHRSETPWIKDV